MAIVDRYPQAIEAKRGDVGRVVFPKKVLEEAIEKELEAILTERASHRCPPSLLVSRKAGDEALHVHPPAERNSGQVNPMSTLVNDFLLPYS
jgi:predicted Zn-dependent peptidase